MRIFIFTLDSNIEIYNETLMYTVATMAALTYPSQCLPDELLEAKIKVIFFQILKIILKRFTLSIMLNYIIFSNMTSV